MSVQTKKDGNVPVLIRVPKPLLKKVDSDARRQDRSRSYLLVELLRAQYNGKAAKP